MSCGLFVIEYCKVLCCAGRVRPEGSRHDKGSAAAAAGQHTRHASLAGHAHRPRWTHHTSRSTDDRHYTHSAAHRSFPAAHHSTTAAAVVLNRPLPPCPSTPMPLQSLRHTGRLQRMAHSKRSASFHPLQCEGLVDAAQGTGAGSTAAADPSTFFPLLLLLFLPCPLRFLATVLRSIKGRLTLLSTLPPALPPRHSRSRVCLPVVKH